MKERPILFSSPMVRALLDGRKTVTRRVVKLPTSLIDGDLENAVPDLMFGVTPGLHIPMPDGSQQRLRNPWGWPDPCRLWVRETWQDPQGLRLPVYRADDATAWQHLKWRPSIFMPRWASRILLEIVSVRVERLQSIIESDAMAEGAEPVLVPPDGGSCPYIEGYRDLWESINGPGSWELNPWVWVIEFKRIEQ